MAVGRTRDDRTLSHEFRVAATLLQDKWGVSPLTFMLHPAQNSRIMNEANNYRLLGSKVINALPLKWVELFAGLMFNIVLYSVRGLERSELGGSHGCPGRLWDRFL